MKSHSIRNLIRTVRNARTFGLLLMLLALPAAVLSSCSSGSGAPSGDTVPETAGEESRPRPENGMLEIIPDPAFGHGFTVRSQKDHANGDAISDLGTFRSDGVHSPAWLIAQWDSGPCLWQDRAASADNVLTDGVSKWVTCDGGAVSLRLNSAPYYETKPDHAAAAGDYWPHLLLECPDFGCASADDEAKPYYSCSAKQLILSFDLKMSVYEQTKNPSDYTEADQFLMYFYIHGKNSNDFVWFGLQLFDSRREKDTAYIGIDGGKADASGSLIYSVGSVDVKKASSGSFWKEHRIKPDGDWYHVEIDLVPHLEAMFEAGKLRNYFSSAVASLDDLIINGMNVGFETIGTYDTEIGIRNLSLVSHLK